MLCCGARRGAGAARALAAASQRWTATFSRLLARVPRADAARVERGGGAKRGSTRGLDRSPARPSSPASGACGNRRASGPRQRRARNRSAQTTFVVSTHTHDERTRKTVQRQGLRPLVPRLREPAVLPLLHAQERRGRGVAGRRRGQGAVAGDAAQRRHLRHGLGGPRRVPRRVVDRRVLGRRAVARARRAQGPGLRAQSRRAVARGRGRVASDRRDDPRGLGRGRLVQVRRGRPRVLRALLQGRRRRRAGRRRGGRAA
mmetsp:Transcript_328/g.1079  ORF Transcript_328/g.1079 Transcript_328/m.1079 type:complete len:259 (+) Transcript_328:513-1289(+)